MTGERSADRIRTLNDHMRSMGPDASGSNRWILSAGIAALGHADVQAAITAVREFTAFSEDNDPHGEHDFGAFKIASEQLFWKIDYYDQSLERGAEDPGDPNMTRRVLTMMLASEY